MKFIVKKPFYPIPFRICSIFFMILLICPLLTACAALRPPVRMTPPPTAIAEQTPQSTSPLPASSPAATFSQTTTATPVVTPEPSAAPIDEIVVTCIGDCTLGGDPRLGQLAAFQKTLDHNSGDLGYFFQNALPYTDGLTIVNLEGPLTTHETGSEKSFSFRGEPGFAGILSRGGVNVVSLANNHSMDYGEQGYADTLTALEIEGIASADIGRPVIYETGEWKIGIVASKFLTKERLKILLNDIAYLKQEGCAAVIAVIHWGEERVEAPSPQIRADAHAIIDGGADLIVGHHPHILQGIEPYNGRLIVYSLGNFVFGGNRNPPERETAIFQQRFVVNDEMLEPAEFRVVPFAVSGSPGNDYRPIALDGGAAQNVYDMINRRGALMPNWITVSEGWQPVSEGE